MTPYATAFRYPSDDPEPPLADAHDAIKMAVELLEFVEGKLLTEDQPAHGEKDPDEPHKDNGDPQE